MTARPRLMIQFPDCMISRGQKNFVFSLALCGTAVLGAAVYLFQEPLRELYHLRQLGKCTGSEKASAARKLGELKSRKAVPLLEAALLDPEKEVRYEVAVALKRIDPDSILFPPYLPDEKYRSKGPITVLDGTIPVTDYLLLASDISGLKFKLIDPALSGRFVEILVPIRDLDWFTIVALLEFNGLRILQPDLLSGGTDLEIVLHPEEDEIRRKANQIIQKIYDVQTQAVAELVKKLKAKDVRERSLALESLGSVHPKIMDTFPYLLDGLADSEPEIRSAAVFAIRQIFWQGRNPEEMDQATMALKKLLQDEDGWVGEQAAERLKEIRANR